MQVTTFNDWTAPMYSLLSARPDMAAFTIGYFNLVMVGVQSNALQYPIHRFAQPSLLSPLLSTPARRRDPYAIPREPHPPAPAPCLNH